MRVLPIVLIALVFLFFAGLIVPRKSKRMQRWINARLEKGKRKGDHRAGFIGDWTAKSLDWGQTMVDKATESGRGVRGRLESGVDRLRERMSGSEAMEVAGQKGQPQILQRLEEKRQAYERWPRMLRILWVSLAVALLLVGVALIFFPGPAMIVIPIGLAMLSLEFAGAARLLERIVEGGASATASVKRAHPRQKLLGGLALLFAATALAVAAAALQL